MHCDRKADTRHTVQLTRDNVKSTPNLGNELPFCTLGWASVASVWFCEIPSSTIVPQCIHFDVVVPTDRTSSSSHCHYSLKTRQSTHNLYTLATSFSLWPTLAFKLKAGVTALGTEIPWPCVLHVFLTMRLRQN